MATGHDMDGVRGSDHITALLASCPHKSQLRGYWLPRGIAAHREFAACLTHDDYSLVDKRGRADGEKPGAHQLQKDTNVSVACREPPTCRPMRPGRRRRSHAEPGVNRAAADRMHCVPQPRRHTPSLAGALSPRVSSQ